MTKILQFDNSIKNNMVVGQEMIAGIAAHHLEDLRKSGLSDDSIVAAGIRSLSPGDISKFIGYDMPDVESAYEIPFNAEFSRIKVCSVFL